MPEKPKTPWCGRFEKPMDDFIADFGASLPVDRRMWAQDIRGSLVHVRMLAARGVLEPDDAEAIEVGLEAIRLDLESGAFTFDVADEDIHMAIEHALIERIGAVGGKLHTARSRNDQVALDLRMWAKDAALSLADSVGGLRRTLISVAEKRLGVILPGYTHMQRAQPVLLTHHLLAYAWMFTRDAARLRHAYEAADSMPLGSAALAGTPFPVDRGRVAEELDFSHVAPNSIDAVSDRDFALDLVYACAVAMMHLSRLCEELIVWSSSEFGFITLDDAYATGSSIMPQKKNPDTAELVRGKTGRVFGDLTSLLVTLKGLPLAYNKDMQEDKQALFDAVDTLDACLRATDGMVYTMHVNEDAMRAAAEGGFMTATDLADYLAERGVPFREAHEIVGTLVLECERSGRTFLDLTAEDLAAVSTVFAPDALEVIRVERSVERRTSEGGTGHQAVLAQLELARDALESDTQWLDSVITE